MIIRQIGRPILTLTLTLNQIGPDQPIFPNPSPSQSSDGVPHRKFEFKKKQNESIKKIKK